MIKKVKLLSLTVVITIFLLILVATLVVLGIFDEILNWDIFSSQVEAVLSGIFLASVALSIFGVAMTLVLGIQEIVTAISSLQQSREGENKTVTAKAPKSIYLLYIVGIFAAFSAIIGTLSFVNYRITVHRTQVFKRIAAEQIQNLQNKFLQQINQLTASSQKNVPKTLNDLIKNVQKLSFVNSMTLYLPDTTDDTVIWSYSSERIFNEKDQRKLERLFVAKEYEKAIQSAFQGKPELLKVINDRTEFQWYYVVKNENNQPIAVLRVNGNPYENFREYKLGI